MSIQCNLCLKLVDKLEDSHYVPAGVYRILHDASAPNPHPWKISATNAVQTANQKKAKLLCLECEKRLNRNGENWILRNCLKKNGEFRLLSTLLKWAPYECNTSTTTRVYLSRNFQEIDKKAIAYFAASIFWRGSIYPWTDNSLIPVSLGDSQENFRRFLMQEEDFPKNWVLWVIIRENKNLSRSFHEPRPSNEGSYKFLMPGLTFFLMDETTIPLQYKKWCFINGYNHPLIVSEKDDLLQIDKIRKWPSIKQRNDN